MNDNHILVVHSRWVYNFMDIIWRHRCLSFFGFYAFFSKNSFQILVIFKPYTLEETVTEKHYMQMSVIDE